MALGNRELVAAMNELIAAFRAKGKEFGSILKMGRTQLQDAVPMTLGQEFNAFAETLAGEVRTLEAMQSVLSEINMGATAIGTGLNAPAGYARKVRRAPGADHGHSRFTWRRTSSRRRRTRRPSCSIRPA